MPSRPASTVSDTPVPFLAIDGDALHDDEPQRALVQRAGADATPTVFLEERLARNEALAAHYGR